jgi:hypothetical protein
MNKFLAYLSSYDYFGHSIVYTFNKKNDNIYRTSFGGLISVILRMGMITYVGLLL